MVSAEEESTLTNLKVNGGKLIGFHTITTKTSDLPELKMIKSIAPILDKSNCENSAADLASYKVFRVT